MRKKKVLRFLAIFLIIAGALFYFQFYKYGGIGGFVLENTYNYPNDSTDDNKTLIGKVWYARSLLSYSEFFLISFFIFIYVIKFLYKHNKRVNTKTEGDFERKFIRLEMS